MKNPSRDSPKWKNTLLTRSREAAVWRAISPAVVGKKASFRSDALRPIRDQSIDAAVVEDVVMRRRRHIGAQGVDFVTTARFLLWFPNQTLSDGAAQLETNGYFDADNQPPWDAWLGWISAPLIRNVGFQKMLVAWVPGDLVEMVSAGVDVNPEMCLQWMGDDGGIQVLGANDHFMLMDAGVTCSWDSDAGAGRST